jgi:hypothetical protein
MALVVALLSPISPVTLPSAGADEVATAGNSLFLQVRGTVDRKGGTAPEHFVYEPTVYDVNNQKIGTVTHDVMFTSPSTADLVSTFHLQDGELANKSVEAIGPDASRQGFYLIGVHADRDTVDGAKSTGAYAGRTGRLRMSGWHDANKFPQTVTFNDFYEITFNP